MKQKDTPTHTKKTSLKDVFVRFHAMFFFLILAAGLGTAIVLLYSIIVSSEESTSYTPTSIDASFDEATIRQARELHNATDPPAPYTPPAGRIDPFSQ